MNLIQKRGLLAVVPLGLRVHQRPLSGFQNFGIRWFPFKAASILVRVTTGGGGGGGGGGGDFVLLLVPSHGTEPQRHRGG